MYIYVCVCVIRLSHEAVNKCIMWLTKEGPCIYTDIFYVNDNLNLSRYKNSMVYLRGANVCLCRWVISSIVSPRGHKHCRSHPPCPHRCGNTSQTLPHTFYCPWSESWTTLHGICSNRLHSGKSWAYENWTFSLQTVLSTVNVFCYNAEGLVVW